MIQKAKQSNISKALLHCTVLYMENKKKSLYWNNKERSFSVLPSCNKLTVMRPAWRPFDRLKICSNVQLGYRTCHNLSYKKCHANLITKNNSKALLYSFKCAFKCHISIHLMISHWGVQTQGPSKYSLCIVSEHVEKHIQSSVGWGKREAHCNWDPNHWNESGPFLCCH